MAAKRIRRRFRLAKAIFATDQPAFVAAQIPDKRAITEVALRRFLPGN